MSITHDWLLELVKYGTIKNKNSGKVYVNKTFVDSLYSLYDDYYKQILPYKESTISFNTLGTYIVKTRDLLTNISKLDELNKHNLDKFYEQLDSLSKEFRERIKPNNISLATNEFNPELKRQLIKAGHFESGYIYNLQGRSDPKYALNKKRLEKTSKQVELDNYMAFKWKVGNENDPTYKKLKGDLNAINSELSKLTTNYERKTASRNTRNSSTSSRGGKRSTRKNKSK